MTHEEYFAQIEAYILRTNIGISVICLAAIALFIAIYKYYARTASAHDKKLYKLTTIAESVFFGGIMAAIWII